MALRPLLRALQIHLERQLVGLKSFNALHLVVQLVIHLIRLDLRV